MIEIQDYRINERLARSVIASWWLAETHQVDHFARSGFPVRIESVHEVGQLIDTMQENRFERFMKELGGLSPEDLAALTQALTEAVKFQVTHLPKRKPIVPFSTMMSSFVLYRKIRGYKADVDSILEVGPGCGYLSFFLARHSFLKDYSQVEVCESFYILQSMINSYLFGHTFRDLAVGARGQDLAIHIRKDVEKPVVLSDDDLPSCNCFHYPWWTLSALNESRKKYDVVTSNANLNEFTRNALRDYLTIFSQAMKDEGIFLVQCTGFTAHGSLEDLFDVLHGFRFAPLFCALAADNIQPQMRDAMDQRFLARGFDRRDFVLNNLILVKETHPLFPVAYDRRNFRHGFATEFQPLDSIYRSSTGGKSYSKDDLLALVRRQLSGGALSEPAPQRRLFRAWRT
jgi:hypothetical protein